MIDDEVPERDWQDLYREGLRSVDDERFWHAFYCFEAAAGVAPDAWEPRFAKVWLGLKHGDMVPDAATDEVAVKDDLDTVLEQAGDACPDAAILRAGLHHKDGEYDKAFRLILRAYRRTSDTDCELVLVDALARHLEAVEREGSSASAVLQCLDLEGCVRAATLPRFLADAIMSEILATHAVVANARDRDDIWGQLAELSPDHPRLPAGAARGQAGRGTRAPGAPEPTFAQLAGHDQEGSFQHLMAVTFDNYFDAKDLGTLRVKLAEFGLTPSRSILMYGPSGAGKTYVVNAFAGEYRHRHGREMPINAMRLNLVMDKWVGETEKAISRIFDQAIATQPSIIFADELDALGSSRERAGEWKAAQAAHFLQEIDRLKQSEAAVLLVGCTNRLAAIDPAMMRRFDELISADLPDATVRTQLFDVYLRKLDSSRRGDDLDLPELARASHGMAPGDIEKAVKKASGSLLLEISRSPSARRVAQKDLLEAVEEYKNPLHIRRWLTESLEALRAAGLHEQAAELREKYRPYISVQERGQRPDDFAPVPDQGWYEEPSYDFGWLRRSGGGSG